MSVPILYAGSRYKPGVLAPIPGPAVPHFASAEIGAIDAMTLSVTFDRDVNANENDYASGVTVKVNGITTGLVAGFRQANHAVVNYVVPVLWHGSADVVTWEYNSAVGFIVAESDAMPLGNVTAQSVTNNCEYAGILDLQADALVLGDTNPVSAWTNLGALGGAFTQSGGARPIYHLGGGMPYVEFIEASFMPASVGINNGMNNLSSFAVFDVTYGSSVGGVDSHLIGKMHDYSTGQGWSVYDRDVFVIQQNGGANYMQWGVVQPTLIGQTEIGLVSILKNSNSNVRIRENSTDRTDLQFDGGPVTDFSNNESVMLGRMTVGSASWIGRLYFLLICQPVPSTTNVAALEVRLAARYGITL